MEGLVGPPGTALAHLSTGLWFRLDRGELLKEGGEKTMAKTIMAVMALVIGLVFSSATYVLADEKAAAPAPAATAPAEKKEATKKEEKKAEKKESKKKAEKK
jgi:hypothetical protein